MSERVFVVGAGRVGRGLALAISRAAAAGGAATLLGVHGRELRDGASTAGAYPPALADANVIVIAVPDAEIEGVARSLHPAHLAPAARPRHGTAVLHTSGIAAPAALDELRGAGLTCGTFHPLVPFPSPERGARHLVDGWIGIDGDAAACAASRRVAAAIGARTVTIPAGHKGAYHAAAVIGSNFPVVLAALAARTLTRIGVDEHTAEQVAERLVRAAADNLEGVSPALALTGPAARGDAGTIAAHRAALAAQPDVLAAYDALTRAAADLAAQRRSLDDADPGGRIEPERGQR